MLRIAGVRLHTMQIRRFSPFICIFRGSSNSVAREPSRQADKRGLLDRTWHKWKVCRLKSSEGHPFPMVQSIAPWFRDGDHHCKHRSVMPAAQALAKMKTCATVPLWWSKHGGVRSSPITQGFLFKIGMYIYIYKSLWTYTGEGLASRFIVICCPR